MENLATPLSEQSKAIINTKEQGKKKNYTFIEILVVISAIGVVVVLALLAINPGKEGAEARNLQRQADISYILTEVSAYSRANQEIPYEIPVTYECVVLGNEICKIGPYDCEDLVNLSILNDPDSENVTQMPTDPLYISVNGTGYYIFQDGEGGVTVCAPYAERNKEISFTKYLY
ncbi:TPA: hypothetical protein DEP90_00680 [Patescibacteria group bacterium]|nr:hypothetical protein [Patescibacteria group bacterium]